jgi:hypothetical protein
MTVYDRLIKYLSVTTKIHMDSRPRLINKENGQSYPIATLGDLKETLYLMQVAASGIRPYLTKWYNEKFIAAFTDLHGKPNEDTTDSGVTIAREKYVGLTTEQLANKIKELDGYKPSSKELLEKYLYPLVNQGVLNSVKSEINRKYNIFFPVEQDNTDNSINKLYSIFDDSSTLRLKIPDADKFPTKNFLKEQFRTLSKRSSDGGGVFEKNFTKYKLVDSDGTEITVDELIDKYYDNPEECFVKGYPQMKEVDYNNDNSSTTPMSAMAMTTRNNVNYQHQIIQKNIFQNNPTLWNNVLTEFSNKGIEESYSAQPEPSTNNKDELYWTKGKWRDYLKQES